MTTEPLYSYWRYPVDKVSSIYFLKPCGWKRTSLSSIGTWLETFHRTITNFPYKPRNHGSPLPNKNASLCHYSFLNVVRKFIAQTWNLGSEFRDRDAISVSRISHLSVVIWSYHNKSEKKTTDKYFAVIVIKMEGPAPEKMIKCDGEVTISLTQATNPFDIVVRDCISSNFHTRPDKR